MTETFRSMDAVVDERIYERMGHTINGDEIRAIRALLAGVISGDSVGSTERIS